MYFAAANSSAVALPRPRISSLARPCIYFFTESCETVAFAFGVTVWAMTIEAMTRKRTATQAARLV